jgi:hypothetical protein
MPYGAHILVSERSKLTMIKLIVNIGLLACLSGCLSVEQIRQNQADTCASYGFRVGTTPFAQCMMQQAKKAELEETCFRAYLRGISGAPANGGFADTVTAGGNAQADCLAGRSPPQPPPPPNYPKNTSCTTSNNSINCSHY